MVKKISYFLIVLPFILFSQETSIEEFVEDEYVVEETIQEDEFRAFIDNKSVEFERKREFSNNLKEKYSGRDFTYTEEEKDEEEEKPDFPEPNLSFVKGFAAFMKTVFPFILGAIVIFIIIRLYLGAPSNLWNSKNAKHKPTDKLVYEDDDIDNSDLDGLLKRALSEGDSRLAIRYYYLILLKKLSDKEIITYDKDKTNSEYLFEIKDKVVRKEFSYLSYVYSYVWYGEFLLDNQDFKKVQERYNSFFKTIG